MATNWNEQGEAMTDRQCKCTLRWSAAWRAQGSSHPWCTRLSSSSSPPSLSWSSAWPRGPHPTRPSPPGGRSEWGRARWGSVCSTRTRPSRSTDQHYTRLKQRQRRICSCCCCCCCFRVEIVAKLHASLACKVYIHGLHANFARKSARLNDNNNNNNEFRVRFGVRRRHPGPEVRSLRPNCTLNGFL